MGYKREVNTLMEDTTSGIKIDVERMVDKLLQKKYRRSKG